MYRFKPYRVQFPSPYGEGKLWVRPVSMWNETVEKDGKTVKRFEFIGNNTK
ncbi:MAG: DUF1653 domain-containing protein [Clostridia bacterium]|nr:DUF1653 domain-containing protein [Clostridia bacterium]